MSASTLAILFLGLLAAYLFGSIPTGFVLAKVLKGIDIREHGSGNTGATNVFRVMGKGPGIAALVIDLLKGVAAVSLMRWMVLFALSLGAAEAVSGSVIYGNQLAAEPFIDILSWSLVSAALMAVIGHSKSVWLGFTGGKSAATGLGVALALAWPVGLGIAAVFAVVVGISRTVSIGSIAAALSATVFMLLTGQHVSFVLVAIAAGLYVVFRHRSNISRLLEGTEPKTFGSKG
ncbi:MAG: glycerol-3-phosphate 1-O-acyltransferase PlsY [Cyanobacteria bacterium J06598_3]